jgi:hypothetical protein
MKKSRFGSAKWLWPSIFAQFAQAGKKAQQNLIPAREHCNKYDLTAAPCSDWPIIMIGRGGLILVVPVLVLWVGMEKINN